MQCGLQVAKNEVFEEVGRGSVTDSEDGSHKSAGETVRPRWMAVHSEELQKVLGRIECDKDGGRAALAPVTREVGARRKEETGVKSLRGVQEVKTDSTDRSFKQAFYDSC